MARSDGSNRVLAVAGNLGAGKSTLVDGLCRHLAWSRVPSKSPDPAYVSRIHEDPARWSFEAQLNFFVLKAASLREASLANRNVVVDRSIYEDRDVMARSWASQYWDDRARATYDDCAEMLLASLPVPDVVIYCRCSLEACEARRSARRRSYQELYDPAWVSRLNDLYGEWVRDFATAPLLELDTEAHDVRDPAVVANVVDDLQAYFASPPPDQMMLFGLATDSNISSLLEPADPAPLDADPAPLHVLRRLNSVRPRESVQLDIPRGTQILGRALSRPAVYLAAPFTAAAVALEQPPGELPLPGGMSGQSILPTEYRESLEAIAHVFEHAGIDTVLPHRDINAWGRRPLTPTDVAQACIDLVKTCDAFVAVLGQSFGAHAELGVAIALRKPCVVIEVAELGSTFMGRGLAQSHGEMTLSAETLGDIPAALDRADVAQLIRRRF